MEAKLPDTAATMLDNPMAKALLTQELSAGSVEIKGTILKADIKYTSQLTDDKKEHLVELSGHKPLVNTILTLGMMNIFKKEQAVPEKSSQEAKDDPCKQVYEFYLGCVESGNTEEYVDHLSRAEQNNFSYYESVFDRKSFNNVCKNSINNNKKMDYSSFRTNVCKNVNETPIEGTSVQGTPINDDKQIKTRFGTIKLQRIEKDSIVEGLYMMLQGKKVYTIKNPGDNPSFYEKSFKVGDTNLFFITTAAGNAAEWSYMVIERNDGIFISDPNDDLPSMDIAKGYITDNKFIIRGPYQYGNDIIVTYDNEKLTRKGNFNKNNGSMSFDTKEIKLIKIH